MDYKHPELKYTINTYAKAFGGIYAELLSTSGMTEEYLKEYAETSSLFLPATKNIDKLIGRLMKNISKVPSEHISYINSPMIDTLQKTDPDLPFVSICVNGYLELAKLVHDVIPDFYTEEEICDTAFYTMSSITETNLGIVLWLCNTYYPLLSEKIGGYFVEICRYPVNENESKLLVDFMYDNFLDVMMKIEPIIIYNNCTINASQINTLYYLQDRGFFSAKFIAYIRTIPNLTKYEKQFLAYVDNGKRTFSTT